MAPEVLPLDIGKVEKYDKMGLGLTISPVVWL